MKKLATGLVLLLLSAALALVGFGYARTAPQYWYPFITSLFAGYYTTGPFAMTSNIREDNPLWGDLPALNLMLARLTYVMTQGEPQADIAWLFPELEWVDKPVIGEGLTPNQHESAISRSLVGAGLAYDRISRRDVLQANGEGGVLRTGAMTYKALLVNDLAVSSPELLARIQALSAQGVPVVWIGAMPQRASGWASAAQRDADVQARVQALRQTVTHLPDSEALPPALARHGIVSPWLADPAGAPGLRTLRRTLGPGQVILLFNDTATARTITPAPGLLAAGVRLLDPESGAVMPLTGETGITIPARRTRLLLAGDTTGHWDAATWQHPSMAHRPYIRWWWPGNAVDDDQLVRDLHSLHDAGFGGVELQTLTIGLKQSQLEAEADAIYQVGTEAYFSHVRRVFEAAQPLGMQVDLTLGSGWPNGGPFIDRHPEQQLLASTLDVTGPSRMDQTLPAPQPPRHVTVTNWIIRDTLGAFDAAAVLEAVVAARVDTTTDPPTLSDFTDISAAAQNGQLRWDVPAGDWRIFTLYRNNTQHNLVASAFPGALKQARVLDHLDAGGVQEYIEELGDPWLQGVAPHKPGAWFVDSFELMGELPWSASFRAAFLQQHGYDITPFLPLVFKTYGESKYFNMVIPPTPAYRAEDDRATRIREDYEQTRARRFHEAFLVPLKQWTTARGIPLRLQAHGGYGDYLDAYQIADIPEGEGLFGGGSFEFLKLASSAGHVAGRRIISSESFITMSLDFNALTADDIYYLAGNAYAAGINRLMYHGHAYSKPLQ